MNYFTGPPGSCLEFLSQLARGHNKTWFDTSRITRNWYENLPGLHPRHVRQTPSDILTFSGRREALQFRHELDMDVSAPGFYVPIEPENCVIEIGVWHPDGRTLGTLRTTPPFDRRLATD